MYAAPAMRSATVHARNDDGPCPSAGRRACARPTRIPAPTFILPVFLEARGGSPDAVERLLHQIYPAIERFLMRRLDSRVLAARLHEDILQEALFRIIRGLPTCRAETEGACWAWLLRVAWRAALDTIDVPELELTVLRSALTQGPDYEDSIAYREWVRLAEDRPPDDPYHVVCQLAVASQECLSRESQSILWARLIEGATWSEIGAAIGTTESGAKRRAQRALRTLRRELLSRVEQLPEPNRAAAARVLATFGNDGATARRANTRHGDDTE